MLKSLTINFTRPRKAHCTEISVLHIQFCNYDQNVAASSKKSQAILPPLSMNELRAGCRLGLDLHADMTCIGRHAHIYEVYHGKVCNVYPFNDSYEPIKDIATVNAAFAYDTEDGQTYIIEVNQCLDFSSTMEHSLLCTNQARINGVVVDDCPTALDPTGRSTHSIYFPEEDKRLPLLSKFPISFLPVQRPLNKELDNCPTLCLTSADEWDTSLFEDIDKGIYSLSQYTPTRDHIGTLLNKKVHISAIQHVAGREFTSSDLAKLWGISLESAKKTLDSTSQNYVRKLSVKISRRFKTTAHQRQYKQLGGYLSCFCSDTFKSNVESTRGNTYVQLFSNRGKFTSCYPIKSKSHAHHALDRFLHEVGIPSELLTDGAKELTQAEWGKSCKRHNIKQITTEPHTP